jgi:diguanylate cyclase (GGDEF)-like protein
MQFAEKIRKLVESTAFRFDDVVIPVTISVGAATMSAVPTSSPAEFVKIADDNLFAAKQGGRNRVVG